LRKTNFSIVIARKENKNLHVYTKTSHQPRADTKESKKISISKTKSTNSHPKSSPNGL